MKNYVLKTIAMISVLFILHLLESYENTHDSPMPTVDATQAETINTSSIEKPEHAVELHILWDSLRDGCYTRFLLAVGENEIYFDGLCEVDRDDDYALESVDLTGDGIPDIAVIFTAGHGTGCLVQEAHIFDGVTFEKYEVRNATDLAHDHLGLSADDDAYYIVTENDIFIINKAEIISKVDYDIELFPLPYFDLICEYKIQNERLCAYLPIQVGIVDFCGEIEILYKFDSNFFDLDTISVSGDNISAASQMTVEKMAEYLEHCGILTITGDGIEYGRSVTYLDALAYAVRLMNCDSYALENEWEIPYVACATSIGLLKDNVDTLYGIERDITAREFVTLLLRALGYDDTFGHFDPDSPWRLSDHIGLTSGQYGENSDDITFGDMVRLMFGALRTNIKNQPMGLYYYYFVYRRFPEADFPEIFHANTNNSIVLDQFDAYKETYIGGKRGGSIGYSGDQSILLYDISDPSVISFEFTKIYTYDGSVMQNFEITGLKSGLATIEITFAEGDGDPRSIAFVDVSVVDEIWEGHPYGN
jgi:hypothetical protein